MMSANRNLNDRVYVLSTYQLFSSAKEVSFCSGLCLCVCAKYLKSYERILMRIFSRKEAYVLGTNRLTFGEDSDSFVDSGSFSRFFIISR